MRRVKMTEKSLDVGEEPRCWGRAQMLGKSPHDGEVREEPRYRRKADGLEKRVIHCRNPEMVGKSLDNEEPRTWARAEMIHEQSLDTVYSYEAWSTEIVQ